MKAGSKAVLLRFNTEESDKEWMTYRLMPFQIHMRIVGATVAPATKNMVVRSAIVELMQCDGDGVITYGIVDQIRVEVFGSSDIFVTLKDADKNVYPSGNFLHSLRIPPALGPMPTWINDILGDYQPGMKMRYKINMNSKYLNGYNAPDSMRVFYSDWFTPHTEEINNLKLFNISYRHNTDIKGLKHTDFWQSFASDSVTIMKNVEINEENTQPNYAGEIQRANTTYQIYRQVDFLCRFEDVEPLTFMAESDYKLVSFPNEDVGIYKDIAFGIDFEKVDADTLKCILTIYEEPTRIVGCSIDEYITTELS